jgi:hypothetical protein
VTDTEMAALAAAAMAAVTIKPNITVVFFAGAFV